MMLVKRFDLYFGLYLSQIKSSGDVSLICIISGFFYHQNALFFVVIVAWSEYHTVVPFDLICAK